MTVQKNIKIRPLTDVLQSQTATVVRIKLCAKEQTRLTQLGVRAGASVRVLQASKGSPLLIAIGDGRIGINYETAQQVFVAE